MTELAFNGDHLVAVLRPLAAYLDRIVLCGGWTLFIYRRWVLGQEGPLPLRTGDVDLAVAESLPVIGRSVEEALQEAGFHPEMYGTGKGVIHFEKEGSSGHRGVQHELVEIGVVCDGVLELAKAQNKQRSYPFS